MIDHTISAKNMQNFLFSFKGKSLTRNNEAIKLSRENIDFEKRNELLKKLNKKDEFRKRRLEKIDAYVS